MRLSAYVNQHGIDAFQFEDFIFVGRQVAKSPQPLIVVGGQALETWGHFFNVPSPQGDASPLTEDTDFLGGKQDATWLCQRLGFDNTELQFPSQDDTGPSAALAYIRRPDGRVLMMDFLHSIVGPSNEKVRRLAVAARVDGVTLSVLHPLLCLESRMANLQCLPSKRMGNGPMQARWAVDIARAYMERAASAVQGSEDADQIASACRMLAEMAEYKYGRYCWINYGLDPLQAVTPLVLEVCGSGFAHCEWPRIVERIYRKRDKWSRIQAMRVERAKENAVEKTPGE